MPDFTRAVQCFYGPGGHLLFDWLYQTVNRQALAPFFRPRLRRQGKILDAGAGSGHLANELGLQGGYFLDLNWEQLKRCRETLGFGFLIQADLEYLPFRDGTFDGVISSNVLHYTGLAGLKELLRVTKSGGQLLLAFLEGSIFTTVATWLLVSLGLFPFIFREARFIDLAELEHLDIKVKESTTIIFLPPLFQAFRQVPRLGLVTFDLEKGKMINA
jgi:SAM-dependent methyltransferase